MYSVSTLAKAAGLSVDSGTGLISGLPQALGMFTVTLSAGNSYGVGTALLTLVLKVVVERRVAAQAGGERR